MSMNPYSSSPMSSYGQQQQYGGGGGYQSDYGSQSPSYNNASNYSPSSYNTASTFSPSAYNFSPSASNYESTYAPSDYNSNYSPSYASNYSPSNYSPSYASNYSPSDYNYSPSSYASNYSPSESNYSNYSPSDYNYSPSETNTSSYSNYSPSSSYSENNPYTYSPSSSYYNNSPYEYKNYSPVTNNYSYSYPQKNIYMQPKPQPQYCPPPQQQCPPQQEDDNSVLIQIVLQLLQSMGGGEAAPEECTTCDDGGDVGNDYGNDDCETCDDPGYDDGTTDPFDPTLPGEGGCGDPHLTQMSPNYKSWYDFQGKKEGGVYNWYSNQNLQVNAKLVSASGETLPDGTQGVTMIGELGIQLKDATGEGVSKIHMTQDGTTKVTKSDGSTVDVPDGQSVTLQTADGDTVIKRAGNKVTIDNPANHFVATGNGTNIDITEAASLKKSVYSAGVLGTTDNGTGKAMGVWDANGDGKINYNDGEGIAASNATDVEIAGGDLWGTTTASGNSESVLFKGKVQSTPDYDGDGKADAIWVNNASGQKVLNAVRDNGKLVGVQKVGNDYFLNDGVGDDKKTHLRKIDIDAQGKATVNATDIAKGFLDFARDMKSSVFATIFANKYAAEKGITLGEDADRNRIADNIQDDADFISWSQAKLDKTYAYDPWGFSATQVQKTAGQGASAS